MTTELQEIKLKNEHEIQKIKKDVSLIIIHIGNLF